jgi:hypothetical protein
MISLALLAYPRSCSFLAYSDSEFGFIDIGQTGAKS